LTTFGAKFVNYASSMRNGRFHPSMCRGKVQNMEVLYVHSPKMPSPSSNLLIKPKNKNKKTKKIGKKKGDQGQPAVYQTAG
jgi:hypothetical protein